MIAPTLVDPSRADEGRRASRAVEAILAAGRESDGHDAVDEAALRRLRHHGLDGTELWLADDDGFAWRHDGELDLVVGPSARGRGIGSMLAATALAEPGAVSAWSHGDDPAARAIGARLGLEATRALWVMRRELGGPLPALALPEGVVIRGYTPDDAAEVLRVNATAFAHHPEQGAMDAGDLAERTAEEWFDAAGLLLAVDTRAAQGGSILGFHWTKRHSATLGEVYVVGIDPGAQGRGLGTALTLAGLHHLADGGSTQVLLYVESDNAPALKVYGGLGFGHADSDTHVQYHRQL